MPRCFPALFLFLVSLAPISSGQQTWVIDTVAGSGPNHVAATSASIGSTVGVATDAAGNVYYTNYNTGQIVEITGGQLLIVAGNGSSPSGQSFAAGGDGGLAILATLLVPKQLALDAKGNIFYPDSLFHRIRKVDANGIITTVAGSGATTNIGGCVFDGDGPALQHALCQPAQVVLDAQGNMFIDDLMNNRIRKVESLGNMTTVAGSGALNVYGQCVFDGDGPATSHSLCSPLGIALDGTGNLYISDSNNQRVRKVDASGNMTTIAGNGTASSTGDGGPAINATLNGPWGLVFDAAGNLYLSDVGSSLIRRIDTTGIISTIAGTGNCLFNGDGLATQQNICPAYLAIDASGDLFFAESDFASNSGVQRIREIDTKGNLSTIAGNGTANGIGTGQSAVNQPLQVPIGLAADPNGNLYVNTGPYITSIGIRKIDSSGVISASPAPGGGQQTALPVGTGWSWKGAGIAADGAGNVFSLGPTSVFKTDSSGNTTTIAGTTLCQFDGDGTATSHSICQPSGIAVDTSGNLFIADTNNCRVREIDTRGNMTTVAGMSPHFGAPGCGFSGDGSATGNSLNLPASVAVDNQGNVYVADSGNSRVRVIDLAASTITTIAGDGMLTSTGQCVFDGDGPALQHSLCSPMSIAVDSAGDVFVADAATVRVREISGGNIVTLAGNGNLGFAGEGSSASSAWFTDPISLALDHLGNLYIADAWNNRVRRMSLTSFAFNASQAAASVSAGGTATYNIQMVAASGFNGSVSLTCSGAPQGATCTPSTSSVNLSAGGSATASFTVTTTSSAAAMVLPLPWGATAMRFGPVYGFGLMALAIMAAVWRRRRLGLGFAAAALVALTACGGSGSSGGGGGSHSTPAGTYNLTLTASSGSITRSTTVILRVQ